MSHYSATTYKTHYICLDCRKQFKRPNAFELMSKDGVGDLYNRLDQKRQGMIQTQDGEVLRMTADDEASWAEMQEKYFGTVVCPQCSKPMKKVSSNFEAPKSKDLRQWEILKAKFATNDKEH